jgi:hypothetical protein
VGDRRRGSLDRVDVRRPRARRAPGTHDLTFPPALATAEDASCFPTKQIADHGHLDRYARRG